MNNIDPIRALQYICKHEEHPEVNNMAPSSKQAQDILTDPFTSKAGKWWLSNGSLGRGKLVILLSASLIAWELKHRFTVISFDSKQG